jgi:hypothetical protein
VLVKQAEPLVNSYGADNAACQMHNHLPLTSKTMRCLTKCLLLLLSCYAATASSKSCANACDVSATQQQIMLNKLVHCVTPSSIVVVTNKRRQDWPCNTLSNRVITIMRRRYSKRKLPFCKQTYSRYRVGI